MSSSDRTAIVCGVRKLRDSLLNFLKQSRGVPDRASKTLIFLVSDEISQKEVMLALENA